MKKLCTVVCLLLTVAMLPVVTLAQSQKNQSENLSQFQTLLKQEQERSSFLDEWNDESIDLFTSIVKDSGIVIEYINPDKYYNGEWLDGNFYNGTCKGYIDSEIWFDGEIHNGNLKNGKIEFSTLKGNWANSIFNGKLSLDNIDYTCKIINEESSNNYLVTIYLRNKVYNTFKANNISINDLFNQLYSEIENKNKLVKQEFYNKYLKEKFFGIEGKYDDIYKSSLLSSFTLAPALDIMSGIFFTSENKLTKMRAANINKNRLNRMLGNMSYNESRGHMLQLLGIVEELNKVEELEYKIINGYLVFGKYKYKIINNNRALYDEEDKKTYPVLSEDKVMKFIKAMGYKGE